MTPPGLPGPSSLGVDMGVTGVGVGHTWIGAYYAGALCAYTEPQKPPDMGIMGEGRWRFDYPHLT